MVQAYYMDDETTDQRFEHHRNPPKFIALEDLFKETGVEYFQVRTRCMLHVTLKVIKINY